MFWLLAVLAYLLGSLSFAILISRITGRPHPRASGSGNAGATNPGYTAGRSISSGWSAYADVIGASDFNSDRRTDLVGYKSDGSLWFFAGTPMNDNGYKPATRIATLPAWAVSNP